MVTSRPRLAQKLCLRAAYMKATSPSGIQGKVKLTESAAFAGNETKIGLIAPPAAMPAAPCRSARRETLCMIMMMLLHSAVPDRPFFIIILKNITVKLCCRAGTCHAQQVPGCWRFHGRVTPPVDQSSRCESPLHRPDACRTLALEGAGHFRRVHHSPDLASSNNRED